MDYIESLYYDCALEAFNIRLSVNMDQQKVQYFLREAKRILLGIVERIVSVITNIINHFRKNKSILMSPATAKIFNDDTTNLNELSVMLQKLPKLQTYRSKTADEIFDASIDLNTTTHPKVRNLYLQIATRTVNTERESHMTPYTGITNFTSALETLRKQVASLKTEVTAVVDAGHEISKKYSDESQRDAEMDKAYQTAHKNAGYAYCSMAHSLMNILTLYGRAITETTYHIKDAAKASAAAGVSFST